MNESPIISVPSPHATDKDHCPVSSVTIWANRDDPDRQRDHVIFRSLWKLDADEAEVLSILSDHTNFSSWWGDIFLGTDVVQEPETGMVGLTGDVTSRGYLPYKFRWRATVIEANADRVSLSARGDFNGTGIFRRPAAGEEADLVFDWDVLIGKPILRFFCPYACRVYLWNHSYAMAVGAKSLQAEVYRRRT